MQLTLPDEANEVTCTVCGADTIVNPTHTAEVNADNGKTNVWLLCSAECGWRGSLFSWQVTPAEYEAIYAHVPDNLLLPGDERLLPPPPDARILPPGPWGHFNVPPSPIPDQAWEIPCPNQVGRWRRDQRCGAILIPDPTTVFYYDEFTSTATVGFRCDVCQTPVLEYLSWPLTPEQHVAIFGRAMGDYHPAYDPDDPDDFQAAYSMWRTTNRAGLTHFQNAEDLAASEDVNLFSIQPGEFTIKHWPTGAVWDAPDFVAQHQQLIATAYQHDDEAEHDDGDSDHLASAMC
ncbi:MAG: hypothetical protein ABW224_13660 [Kibdelosporangium sp.]